jgi:hypothetical protein
MDDQPRRLFNHGEIVVLVKDVERNIACLEGRLRRRP